MKTYKYSERNPPMKKLSDAYDKATIEFVDVEEIYGPSHSLLDLLQFAFEFVYKKIVDMVRN
jgi:hypothetical protein